MLFFYCWISALVEKQLFKQKEHFLLHWYSVKLKNVCFFVKITYHTHKLFFPGLEDTCSKRPRSVNVPERKIIISYAKQKNSKKLDDRNPFLFSFLPQYFKNRRETIGQGLVKWSLCDNISGHMSSWARYLMGYCCTFLGGH